MAQPTFRFAPSPNGRLHLGHAYSALLNEHMARAAGGRLLLRIEDTDQTRCKAEFTQSVIEDLAWLGLSFDESPRIQSQHLADYDAALMTLWAEGCVYPCFCSRKDVARQARPGADPDGQPLYGGRCGHMARDVAAARMAAGENHGWRLRTVGTPAALWGDVMIAKPKVGSSYHIAVVVDDAAQGVSHVVRGQDMEAATPVHVLLQQRLGLPSPHYFHHKLIMHDSGRKLAKSHGDTALAALRAQGVSPGDIRRQLGF